MDELGPSRCWPCPSPLGQYFVVGATMVGDVVDGVGVIVCVVVGVVVEVVVEVVSTQVSPNESTSTLSAGIKDTELPVSVPVSFTLKSPSGLIEIE